MAEWTSEEQIRAELTEILVHLHAARWPSAALVTDAHTDIMALMERYHQVRAARAAEPGRRDYDYTCARCGGCVQQRVILDDQRYLRTQVTAPRECRGGCDLSAAERVPLPPD